ncbi:squalene synthetase [Ascosphaera apis ARSEF 7405]|uniref:Squalene synthase n=1 Tax=Ascosphaera apis ARSEF 7405 TaxID=392613 RepID=A0A167VJB7_9EURO|nr:squalene synthetase [Ascosphaera apis ARSEF 7405]
MPAIRDIAYYAMHPYQLRSICQWNLWHNPVHDHELANASETQLECLKYLKMTSRSFSAVIMELHPDLLMPVCLFYLILRGLDTIEDDTSIPFSKKEILLREFESKLEEDGWTFTGNRETEKDRELLVHFDKIKPAFQTIIKNITARMGSGMADYARRADLGDDKIETVKDYDLYCYYVAGLVGEGLTRLFVEAGFANPALMDRPELFISMGLFLQKTNIIRDVREDNDDNRRFWPKEIWSKHLDKWEDLFDPAHRDAALNVNSEMISDALNHFDQCLFYLSGLKEQSVFNFCAIPQSMAIATLELCFRNPDTFERNIKITKGDACSLMWASTQNLRVLCEVIKQYMRRIHAKNTPKDPNFLKISAQCGAIEKFITTIFPVQTPDKANKIMKLELAKKAGDVKTFEKEADLRTPAERAHDQSGQAAFDNGDICLLLTATLGSVMLLSIIMMAVAQYFGARFDLAFKEIYNTNIFSLLMHGNLTAEAIPGASEISTGMASATSAIREEL